MTKRTLKYLTAKKLRKARKRIQTKHKKAWAAMGTSISQISKSLKEAGESFKAYVEAYNNSSQNN